MKARVNRTGKIVTIMENIGYPGGYVASDGRTYRDEDLTLIVDEEPDYWTRLEHQYVGMAMLFDQVDTSMNGTRNVLTEKNCFPYGAHLPILTYG